MKEERRAIKITKYTPLVFLYNRRQLKEITYIDHLYTTERNTALLANVTKHYINRIQYITSHHGDLIDNQQLDFFEELAFVVMNTKVLQQCIGIG